MGAGQPNNMSKVKNPMALTLTAFSSLGMVGLYHTILGTAIGILGTAAGIGSTFMPWSMSWVSQDATLKRGFLFVLFSALLTFILLSFSFKRLRLIEKAT